MRMLEHKEGYQTLGSVEGAYGRESGREGWGGITWEEMSGIDDGEMMAANHLAMNVPIQQYCMISTCNPESKI